MFYCLLYTIKIRFLLGTYSCSKNFLFGHFFSFTSTEKTSDLIYWQSIRNFHICCTTCLRISGRCLMMVLHPLPPYSVYTHENCIFILESKDSKMVLTCPTEGTRGRLKQKRKSFPIEEWWTIRRVLSNRKYFQKLRYKWQIEKKCVLFSRNALLIGRNIYSWFRYIVICSNKLKIYVLPIWKESLPFQGLKK